MCVSINVYVCVSVCIYVTSMCQYMCGVCMHVSVRVYACLPEYMNVYGFMCACMYIHILAIENSSILLLLLLWVVYELD